MNSSDDARSRADRRMMARCIALSREAHAAGEYPFGAVIARGGDIIAEGTNRIAREDDVTRHAEMVALKAAQAALGSDSLDGCALYVNVEPCAMCSFAVRESRIGRVVFGLMSPHMGGFSKWNILGDADLWRALPEVYAPAPEIVAGFMAAEAARAIAQDAPLVWRALVNLQALRVPAAADHVHARVRHRLLQRVMRRLRRALFDRFGRR